MKERLVEYLNMCQELVDEKLKEENKNIVDYTKSRMYAAICVYRDTRLITLAEGNELLDKYNVRHCY